ncbi:Uncharacterised protein [Nocardia otitidiscaviarum]|uniref:Uncharacterized protein n=1 Tax=Nocardia otitidiscaviarum TaxID=1823 RepID=A0A378YK33_9NOCA|nr:hypothetical protein [Nocardia otitidiscaviarum]SUA76831.1 Uncharacterised protein [Nocardia otitidiscaviarum]
MVEYAAALEIPTVAYWALPGITFELFVIGAMLSAMSELFVEEDYKSRVLGRFIDPDDHFGVMVVRGLLGNGLVTAGIVILVIWTEPRNMWDGAALAVLLSMLIPLGLWLALVFDDMPLPFAGVQLLNWVNKLFLGTMAITQVILYPEALLDQ